MIDDDALVDPFVAAAQHHEVAETAQPLGMAMVESRPVRGRQNHRAGLAAVGANRGDRLEQRLRLQDHSWSAAEGHVVHHPMAFRRLLP